MVIFTMLTFKQLNSVTYSVTYMSNMHLQHLIFSRLLSLNLTVHWFVILSTLKSRVYLNLISLFMRLVSQWKLKRVWPNRDDSALVSVSLHVFSISPTLSDSRNPGEDSMMHFTWNPWLKTELPQKENSFLLSLFAVVTYGELQHPQLSHSACLSAAATWFFYDDLPL